MLVGLHVVQHEQHRLPVVRKKIKLLDHLDGFLQHPLQQRVDILKM